MSTNSRERKRQKEYERGYVAALENRNPQPGESRSYASQAYKDGARDASEVVALRRPEAKRLTDARADFDADRIGLDELNAAFGTLRATA